MRVIVVRHAQTQWNQRGIVQGHKDSPLTAQGVQETSALLQALRDENYPIECVYASPLGRAWQMGQALAGGFFCPLVAAPALCEQHFGDYEGLPVSQLHRDYPEEAQALFARDAGFQPPGGESLAQAAHRLVGFLHQQRDAATHDTLCVVTHGQITQAAMALLSEGTFDNFRRYAQPNASYSLVEMTADNRVTIRWGIATHLRHLR